MTKCSRKYNTFILKRFLQFTYTNLDGSQKEGCNFLNLLQREGVPRKGGSLRKGGGGGGGGSKPVGNYDILAHLDRNGKKHNSYMMGYKLENSSFFLHGFLIPENWRGTKPMITELAQRQWMWLDQKLKGIYNLLFYLRLNITSYS